jgi:hypothetical protein
LADLLAEIADRLHSGQPLNVDDFSSFPSNSRS